MKYDSNAPVMLVIMEKLCAQKDIEGKQCLK